MLIPEPTIREIEPALHRADGDFRVAVFDVDLDPLEFVRAAHDLDAFAAYFGRPGGMELGGVGTAWESGTSAGEGRLLRLLDQLPSVPGARFVIGYSFEDGGPTASEWENFGPVKVVLPELSVVRDRGRTRLIVVAADRRIGAPLKLLRSLRVPDSLPRRHAADRTIESVPAPGDWMEAVDEAVTAIRHGAFEKVVLARSVLVTSDVASDPFDLASRLRAGYPGCFTYAWRAGEDAFVGASPELLASVRGGVVVSEPLAGTTARGEGDDHDRALGEQLMASAKNRLEHQLVIEDISQRLGDLTTELVVPATPTLRRMANVQHLSTHIEGKLRHGLGLLEVVAALHPTPAVGGSPTDEAVMMINKMERVDRGWYSGGIGWVDGEGDGEVAIALRCALLRGSTARLFAGAGIVAASDAQSELDETRLKFGPMLSLLTEA